MIKYVFFDLDDTLLDFHKAERIALTKTLLSLGIDVNDNILDRYSVLNISQWKRLERGEITRQEVKVNRYRLLFDEFGIDASAEQATAIYEENLAVGHYFIDGALEILEKLYGKYKLYLVSNGSKRVQDGRLASAGISKYFDDIFISQTVGVEKPSKLFFDRVFSTIDGFDKTQAVIVGDSLTSDIQGGINAGIKTIWFNRRGETATKIHPTYQASSHTEVYNLIADNNC